MATAYRLRGGFVKMKKIYIKEEFCIGCHLCEVYCRLAHSQSNDLIKAFKLESHKPLPRLCVEERKPVSFSIRCQHCPEPPCVYACLTGALRRDSESGVIVVDAEKCIGCWTCVLVCPFGAIIQDTKSGKIVKCDLCLGKDLPECVSNCPNEALIYAEVREM